MVLNKESGILLSVIIPIYKVEPYIKQCLKSILEQRISPEMIELVLVNDGTPDNSMCIVDELIAGENNVKVINQENQGLSVARNAGLDHARGKYIWFIDSDDWLEPDAFDTVKKSIERYPDIDVFASVLKMNYEKTGKVEIEYEPNYRVKSGRDYLFRNGNANRGACQRYIFRHDFLKKYNLLFMPHVYHEDGEFGNRMLYLAESLMIIDKPLYNYRIRMSGSIMSSRPMKANEDLIKVYSSLKRFAEEHVAGNDDYWMYMVKIYSCLRSIVLFSKNDIFTREFDVFYQENKNIIKNEAKRIICRGKNLPLGYYFEMLPYALFPKLPTQIRQSVKWLLGRLSIII